jgi:hypothetical protein
MRNSQQIEIERLRHVLQYNPETGVFTWRVNRGQRARAGSVAGSYDGEAYWRIQIDRKKYKAHRLAWFYVHEEWPQSVDHRNGDTLDNSLGNLRAVSHAENHQNRRTPNKGTKVGVLGVDVHNGMFRARITKNGKQIHLGYFETNEQAYAAYIAAKRVVHPFGTL